MRRLSPLLVLAGALALFGCGANDSDPSFKQVPNTRGFIAAFNLLGTPVIPSAINLLFSGSLDGTLNIPFEPADPRAGLFRAINALDGFSTVAPVSTTFRGATGVSAKIDPASLTPSSVRMFEVSLSGIGGAVTAVNRELAFGVEFVATLSSVDPAGATLVILPLQPLAPLTSYLVALTNGIRNVDDFPAMADENYLQFKTTPNDLTGTPFEPLEPVRRLVQAQEAALAAFGMNPEPIVLSWTFTTQSAGVVLGTARSLVQASPPAASVLADSTLDSPLEGADVYVGTLDVPYYLTAAASPFDTAPLTTWWQAENQVAGENNLTFLNPLPGRTSVETIPLIASIPKGPKPAGGKWPVVIYQHGLAIDRTTLLAIADALAGAGLAAVAIDLPLHGVTNAASPFYAAGLERTFDLDLVNNATGAPGPDGNTDDTGTHYINLASLLTTRDNGRQATADLFVLHRALQTMDYDGDRVADFDTDNVYFVAYSTGGFIGASFLTLEPTVKSAVFANVGGGLGKVFDGSLNYGPRLEAGLAANGILRGTPEYETFIAAFQTVVDSSDPINYTAGAVANRGFLLFEVLGDRVVPNNVLADAPPGVVPSPTAGTDPMAFFMGLIPVSDTTGGAELKAWVRFTAGHHGSLLRAAADPDTNPVPTAEEVAVQSVMQTAMAAFLATDGATVRISDPSVVE